ncbi:MAG: pyridoxal phosphate-dependent aminotransferase [bacterium]|nr:pyridoxal phosphate-dependent aminotransferase [bacterium]
MFANSHKEGLEYEEPIFKYSGEAVARAQEIGSENVINGTIGALLDKGSLVTFAATNDVIPHLDVRRVSAYSPMDGFPQFIDAIRHFCFEEFIPSKPTAGVAVAGGLGGIRQAVINYTEIGDSVILPDWYWGPYYGLMEDNYRKIATFNFFKDHQFDLESFKECVADIAKKQASVFILFNSPANNPTGYSLDMEEWDLIFDYLNGIDRNIILFLDSAYLDYAEKEDKEFFRKLDNLDSNVLTIVCYSISKSFAKYGMRVAALLAVHEDEKALTEFRHIITLSNRGCYGSVNSIGQLMIMAIYEDKTILNRYYEEFNHWKSTLRKRADVFMTHIDKSLITPYKNGFFVSIRSAKPKEDVEALKKENIFLVPIPNGIRVAFCSIEEEQMERLATTINRVIGWRGKGERKQ